MGAVDLVIQVESPKSVARGLQRIGRAGHELGAVSKGRIFPKFRADLLESAVVARAMRERRDRGDADPAQPARRARAADRRDRGRRGDRRRRPARARARAPIRSPTSRARSSRTCSTCSPAATRRTSSPSCGRGSSGTAPAARSAPATARGGSRSRTPARSPTAASSASSSSTAAAASASSTRRWSTRRAPARRSCSARRPGGSRRSRATACSSRRRRACRARCRSGRARASAARTSSARRSAPPRASSSALGDDDGGRRGCATSTCSTSAPRATCSRSCASRPTRPAPCRPTARSSSSASATRSATGASASSRRSAAACTRRGRWRSPRRLRESLGARGAVDLVGRRDRAPLPRRRRAAARDGPAASTPDEVEELVVAELGETALFGARFRENAARALLIPRRRPGQRTPLWQQRLKAQSLLQVARRYGSFPVVLETYRECLQDVFDLPALRAPAAGHPDARSSTSSRSRPRAPRRIGSSLLFDYIATYMYEDDTPPAERRAQALSLDRDLLRELLGQEELRDLLDADARRRGRAPAARRRRARPTSCTTCCACAATCAPASTTRRCAAPLLDERRAVRRPHRRRGAADRRRGRGPLPRRARRDAAVGPAGRVPRGRARTRCGSSCCASRRAAGRSRRAEADDALRPRRRRGAGRARARGAARARRAAPGGSEREWCDPDVLRRLRRASLAALRREVEPVEQAALARFLPSWHGIDRRASLREALVPLQALALPVALWESELLPRRVPGYRPEQLDALCASGEVVWVGAGLDRVAVYFREDAAVLGRVGGRAAAGGRGARRRSARRSARGALFWLDLLAETGLADEEALPALWDLVWAGEVTNDAWTPLRAGRRYGVPRPERRPRRFSRARGVSGATATQGRWSRTERLFAGAEPERRALAELLLERQGIVTRDGVRAEGIPGGYGAVYARAARARDARPLPPRLLRRGARRRAVRARRRGRAAARAARRATRTRRRSCSPPPIRRSRTAPRCRGRSAPAPAPRASPGRYVVLLGGEAALYVERGGRSLVPLRDPDEAWLRPALARARRPTSARAAPSGSRSSASTASRWPRATRCRCSSRPASSPGRAAPCCVRSPRT